MEPTIGDDGVEPSTPVLNSPTPENLQCLTLSKFSLRGKHVHVDLG
jgi:hypothetical protein